MTLLQLETFRLIAETGSFTRASQILNTTQSTVSMRIAQLERELGVQLLDRSKRAIRLTSIGRNLRRYAEEFHTLTNALKRDIANPETTPGVIKIGVAELIALTWLPQLVGELNRQYPKLDVEIDVGLSGNMYERVLRGEIDICLHPAEIPLDPALKSTLLGNVKFAYMASPRLNLPVRRLRPRDLIKTPLISFGPASMLSETQERWFTKSGARSINFKWSNSMEVCAGLVRSGLGISFLPKNYYAADAQAGHLRVLDVTPAPAPIPFFAIHTANNTSRLVTKIVDIAKNVGEFETEA
ncbi:MAG: DNA-binding transcriptional LysR family regulator [Alphaproteobacteria bacterium]|jgi:DNA-binding transcriptional LysR family regulator